jgi:hypothetical protein
MNQRVFDLVLSFALDKTSEDDFLRQFPASPEDKRALGLRLLREGLAERDSDAVWAGTFLAYRFGLGLEYVHVFEQLAGEDWHRKHEDVVFALGKIAAPTSIAAVLAAARSHHPYLEQVDNSFPLRLKTIHALGNIGTPDAAHALADLYQELRNPGEEVKSADDEESEESESGMENSDLRAEIVRQLRRLAERGATDEVRALAKDVLSRANAAGPKDEA